MLKIELWVRGLGWGMVTQKKIGVGLRISAISRMDDLSLNMTRIQQHREKTLLTHRRRSVGCTLCMESVSVPCTSTQKLNVQLIVVQCKVFLRI